MARPQFALDDTAQQIVGGILLAGPFVVTEEVWRIAVNMSELHVLTAIGIVFTIGYVTLYEADRKRDIEKEDEVAGIPLRFLSLMFVSYGSVALLAFLLAAPETFQANMYQTAKVISIGALFSVVGAATADSIF